MSDHSTSEAILHHLHQLAEIFMLCSVFNIGFLIQYPLLGVSGMENGNHNIGLIKRILKMLILIYFIQVWRRYEKKYFSCEMQA